MCSVIVNERHYTYSDHRKECDHTEFFSQISAYLLYLPLEEKQVRFVIKIYHSLMMGMNLINFS